MAVNASRTTIIKFTGDINSAGQFPAADNANSPGQVDLVTLAIGDNTITPPLGGSTPKAVTIIPPAGNVATITLKGVTGDTGIVLHLTDPTTIALNSPTGTFVLTASAIITGVRLVWS